MNILLLPLVSAQVGNSLAQTGIILKEVFGGIFQLLGGILLGIFGGFFDLLKANPFYGRILIAIVVGIIIYDRLKDIDTFKERAGVISFIIVLITFAGLPTRFIDEIFRVDSSGMLFLIGIIAAGIILAISKGDSNWSRFGRFTAYIMLTIAFASIVTFVEDNSILTTGASLLTAGFALAAIWNIIKIKFVDELKEETEGWGSKLWGIGTKERHPGEAAKKAMPSFYKGLKGLKNLFGRKKNNKKKETGENVPEMDEEEVKEIITNLENIKEKVKESIKQINFINSNLLTRNPTEENIDNAYKIILNISNIFHKKGGGGYLKIFRFRLLHETLDEIDSIIVSFADYLQNLNDKTIKEKREELIKDKDKIKAFSGKLKELMEEIIKIINSIQKGLKSGNIKKF